MLTQAQNDAIARQVNSHTLSRGIGNKESMCALAAINLALTGELKDTVPDCMSPVIGRWIITIQDAMPDAMRNSGDWKTLLPLAAGTGRERETARCAIVLDWMWTVVLPQLQPTADRYDFGEVWQAMSRDKTRNAAYAAAARAAAYAAAAYAAAYAAAAVRNAADAAAYAAYAAADAADAADAAARAARAARAADAADAADAYWRAVDPCALLRKLIDAA